jgi:hypothetical protein
MVRIDPWLALAAAINCLCDAIEIVGTGDTAAIGSNDLAKPHGVSYWTTP